MNIDKIVTNTISTLVTAIVVGACAIVWKGATTVDDKVNEATQELATQAEYITKAVELLEAEVLALKKVVADMDNQEVEVPTKQFIQKQLPKIRRK